MDQLPLRGQRRGFSPSSSISSSITHRRVICVCTLLPYSFTFHFTAVIIWICVRVACLFICSHLHYSTLRTKCKIFWAVTLIWGSKQLLCFLTHFRAFTLEEAVMFIHLRVLWPRSFMIFIVWWTEELFSQHFSQVGDQVAYWDLRIY